MHSKITNARNRRCKVLKFLFGPAPAPIPCKNSWKQEVAGFIFLAIVVWFFISVWRAEAGGVEHIAVLDWPMKVIGWVFGHQ